MSKCLKRDFFQIDQNSPYPFYVQIKNFLASEIRKGVYKKGDFLPSIAEVEKMTSCGRVTVVRAMRELVKEAFVLALNGKGYYVTAKGETALVGLVLPLHSSYFPIYANLVSAFQVECAGLGLSCIFASSDETFFGFERAINELVHFRGCRVLLLVPPLATDNFPCRRSLSVIKHVCKVGGVRAAIIDRLTDLELPHFLQDYDAGIFELFSHCRALGLNRVIFDSAFFRKEFFCRVIEERVFAKIKFSFADFAKLLKSGKCFRHISCDAIFCEDMTARRITQIFGEKPPFRIFGWNGTAIAYAVRPFIDTLDPGFPGAVRPALDLLLSEEKKQKRLIIKLKPSLRLSNNGKKRHFAQK